MLTADNVVKLIDFGFAKTREHSIQQSSAVFVGTTAWMAPEKMLGEPGERVCVGGFSMCCCINRDVRRTEVFCICSHALLHGACVSLVKTCRHGLEDVGRVLDRDGDV